MKLFDSDLKNDGLNTGKRTVLGIQHTFTMFGATVLVPILTGLNISVALFMAGVGTLVFHLITKGKVPAFLGSSFAFIVPIVYASAQYGQAQAMGGVVVAGGIYILFAILVYFLGAKRIMGLFPPVVTGSIIMVIGLKLAPTAIGMASENWWLALVSFAIVVVINVFTRGFIKSLPVLIGLVGSYVIAMIFGLVDYSGIAAANWVGLPPFIVAKFELSAILAVAPIAICTMVEHIGDVVAIGATCDRDFIKDPGLHRTILGDGVATMVSAMFGGPANTTYSENTGVLALTRAFNPVIMRIAAVSAIILGLVPKLGAIFSSIPGPIIGGISIVLFGMIAAVGARTLVENKVDFTQSRNLIIMAAIMVLGLGGASIPINAGQVSFAIEGMALAAIVGIILNQVLPGKPGKEKKDKTTEKPVEQAEAPPQA